MDLLIPVTYRLERKHDAWLQARANTEKHGSKAAVLRFIIEKEMRVEVKTSGHRKNRAA